jgi:glycosyltransferase involved in cell wall biosynthesis
VEALALLPETVTLTLVDNDHPDNEIFGWAREYGVAERLDVVGRVSRDELLRLYQRATIAVVPSRYEGFGLPAVEAMACGTPVVACEAGALPEVMRVAGGGVLVPPADPTALARGIRELIERPQQREQMSRRARSRVVDAFSWSQVARATARVYREVLDVRRGRPTSTITSASSG